MVQDGQIEAKHQAAEAIASLSAFLSTASQLSTHMGTSNTVPVRELVQEPRRFTSTKVIIDIAGGTVEMVAELSGEHQCEQLSVDHCAHYLQYGTSPPILFLPVSLQQNWR